MERFLQAVKVIISAAPTWLTVLSGALTLIINQLELDGAVEAAGYLAQVVVWIGVAISIIRLVTPVNVDERGILPKPDGRYDP